MKRLFYSGIILTLFWAGAAPAAFALAEVRSSAVVEKSTITLGDLLDNLDEGHDIWVSNSPAPGERATISTRFLASLTREHGVYWRNSRNIQQIVITRKGKTIPYADLKPLIEHELAAEMSGNAKMGITFENRNAVLSLPEDGSLDDVRLDDFTFSPRTKSFTATVSVALEHNETITTTIRGRTYAEQYVPALNKSLRHGEQITENDITWLSMPSQRIGRNIIRKKSDLIGMTPRRRMASAVPVRQSDLQRPQIITRDKPVTIIFQSGKITLTAIGKAVENGGRGDIIQVMNIKSHKTIDAVVTGPQEVQVLTAQSSAAQLSALR